MLTSAQIKARALELGFDLCGVAPAADLPELDFLRQWLDRGFAGGMTYLHRTARARARVRNILPSARSVIVAATVYNVDRPYSLEVTDPGQAAMARYSWGDDYHDVMKERLVQLLAWMRRESDGPFEARAYVDTGPVQERVYAQHAGLGWIGKHTCVINDRLGSWLFLSEIISSLPLEADQPATERCGTCRLCMEACPTGALVEPWALDATRCLSYLTIELRGGIPTERRASLGAHVFGCDVCQEVCPWNMAAARSGSAEWMPRSAFDRPNLLDLWRRSDGELREQLRCSPMKRAGLVGLRRNVATAIGNCGDPSAADVFSEAPANEVRQDESPSRRDPMVLEHVAWAETRLRGGAG